MKGYSALHTFNEREHALLIAAERIVATFPERMDHATMGRNAWLRCHEVARAVGQILGLEVQDGFYGGCDHSWCRISKSVSDDRLGTKNPYIETWNLLDVYAVGRLPLVQLVSPIACIRDFRALPKFRDDIDEKVVKRLIKMYQKKVRQ